MRRRLPARRHRLEANPGAERRIQCDIRAGGEPAALTRRRRPTAGLLAVIALFGLGGCSGLYFGDNPGSDVRKETGPLTVPPPDVRAGTAK